MKARKLTLLALGLTIAATGQPHPLTFSLNDEGESDSTAMEAPIRTEGEVLDSIADEVALRDGTVVKCQKVPTTTI